MTDSLATCRASIAQHSKSFALASTLLPRSRRDHVAVIYAWCRRVDDGIDLVQSREQPAALQRLRLELESVFAGEALRDPVLTAFQTTVQELSIPRTYPEALLDGMAMDVSDYRYESWRDLLLYSYRVASTVGLMMCHVMDVRDPKALPHARDLGIAMQLTNIARDVHEDWQRGRLYLPDELLTKHGATRLRSELGGPLSLELRDICRPVLEEVVAISEHYYLSADEGLRYLDWRDAFAVASARKIYADIGGQLSRTGYDALAPRAYVPSYRKLLLIASAAMGTLLRAPPKAPPTPSAGSVPAPHAAVSHGPKSSGSLIP